MSGSLTVDGKYVLRGDRTVAWCDTREDAVRIVESVNRLLQYSIEEIETADIVVAPKGINPSRSLPGWCSS